ncbi:hypothetical protein DFR31_0227 [Alkalispirillum mobile]|uniref:Uncharacterized protein n=1 Tax=Alkalispirillum mobile TaxID=85925 RepID=A0A498CDJ5_9GAMM|nr:hypothetical protein [Alkalispirillum mobile]RLK50331.1 hypothetical protein DFR31_0227 [Alkalispirillum mobile]
MRLSPAFLSLFMLLLLVGCAGGRVGAFEAQTNAWLGQPVNDLVEALGEPTGRTELTEGETVWRWSGTVPSRRAIFDDTSYSCQLHVHVVDGLVQRIRYVAVGDRILEGPEANCRQVFSGLL